jgi:hypothetical protein
LKREWVAYQSKEKEGGAFLYGWIRKEKRREKTKRGMPVKTKKTQ